MGEYCYKPVFSTILEKKLYVKNAEGSSFYQAFFVIFFF